jgi:outer membrane immunogenic protein
MSIRRKTHNGLRRHHSQQRGWLMDRRTRIAIGFAAAALAIAPASAANWNGFYIGLHAGGATGDVDWKNVTNTTGGASRIDMLTGETVDHSPDGVLGGAQIGFNYQFTNWLVGLEVSGSGLDFDETTEFVPATQAEFVSSEIEWLATGAARLGFTSMDSLFYLKGGYATANIATAHTNPDADGGGADLANSYSTDETHHGWVAGAGFEHMIGSNVSVGVEYNYIDLGNTDHTGVAIGGTVVNDIDSQIHAVTARLNVNLYTP